MRYTLGPPGLRLRRIPAVSKALLERAARALFAAALVLALGEPRLVRRGMLLLDPLEPRVADRIRDDRLQPVVGVDLGDGVEHPRTVLGLTGCFEPQLRIDDQEASPVALRLEAEREPLTVLGRRQQAVAPAAGVRGDVRVDERRY